MAEAADDRMAQIYEAYCGSKSCETVHVPFHKDLLPHCFTSAGILTQGLGYSYKSGRYRARTYDPQLVELVL